MRATRLIQMGNYIEQHEHVTMTELCEAFSVSMNTARRDVTELLKRGTIEKVYGGVSARSAAEHSLMPFEARQIDNRAAKALIGRCAAELVRDGDIVFLDSGTTTLQVVEHLSERKNLTIVTNNLEAIVRLLPLRDINVICLPGELQRKTNSFTGLEAARALRSYNIHLALMAATGATQNGLTNSSPMEYEIKQTAVEVSQRAVLLMAGAKFGHSGLMTYARYADFSAMVTDSRPQAPYDDILAKNGVELIIAK